MMKRIENWKTRLEGEEMMVTRLWIMFFLALLTDVLGCAFGYSTAHKMVMWVGILGFFLPIINFTISLIFLEAKTLRERLYIMLINSVALSIGGTTVSLYFS